MGKDANAIIGKKLRAHEHSKSAVAHARRRLLERYNLGLSQADYEGLVKLIKQNPEKYLVESREDKTKKVYKLPFSGTWVYALFDEYLDVIRTFYPKESYSKKIILLPMQIEKFREGKVLELWVNASESKGWKKDQVFEIIDLSGEVIALCSATGFKTGKFDSLVSEITGSPFNDMGEAFLYLKKTSRGAFNTWYPVRIISFIVKD